MPDPLKELTDPPLIPFFGISAPVNGPVLQEVYYRNLLVDSSLTMTTNKNFITLGIAGGAGTVTDINGITGSVSFVNGIDTSLTIGSTIAVNVISSNNASANTIVKRDANGRCEIVAPVLPAQIANKEYVDSVAVGLRIYSPVRVIKIDSFGVLAGAAGPGVNVVFAGTGIGKTLSNNGSVSGFAALSIDGVALSVSDRVLIAGNTIHNGIYDVTVIGDGVSVNWVLTRSADFDETADISSGAYVFIREGSTYQSAGFSLVTTGPIVPDTTNQVWIQFNAAGQVTAANIGVGGQGLFAQKNGNVLEFYKLNAASNRVSIFKDLINNEIDVDVNESNMNLNSMLGPLFPLRGGTGLSSLAVGNFLISNGLGAMNNSKVAPAGVVIGSTDTQTMINKTLIGSSNLISAAMLRSSTTDVAVNGTTPSAGNVLVATSSTSAQWQEPFTVSGSTTTSSTSYGNGAASTLGLYGLAVGTTATSNGTFAIAVGNNSVSSGTESIAIGRNSTALHNYSIALGNVSTTMNSQLRIAPSIAYISAIGVSTVGSGVVVCRNSAGDIGPNTSGYVGIPSLTTDPTNAVGAMYYNSASGKMRVSNGSTYNDLAMSSKVSFTGLTAGGYLLAVFPDTAGVAAFWRYSISSAGVGFRVGTISATWDAASNTVIYDDVTSSDIGNTSPINLSVAIVSNNLQLQCGVVSGSWNVSFYEELF
jgi:hypothetical protein